MSFRIVFWTETRNTFHAIMQVNYHLIQVSGKLQVHLFMSLQLINFFYSCERSKLNPPGLKRKKTHSYLHKIFN